MARHWIAPEWGTPETWRFEHYDPPTPGPGEVTIRVHAAGVNPADAKHVAEPRPGALLPVAIGYEVSGELSAIGPGTEIGSGPASVGDEVLAFRVRGGYATALTVPAEKVFHKPVPLSHPEAANLLLAGTTAAEMLSMTAVAPGETVLLHAASGAVGVSAMQQAAHLGARVIGTDEAVATSLEFVAYRSRIVTIAAAAAARAKGFTALAGSLPASAAFRDAARARLMELAGRGDLVVPVAHTFALGDAPAAHRMLRGGHPGGKLALIP